MSFVAWPSIEHLHSVQKFAYKNNIHSIMYRPKVKLHGTNAAVRVYPEGKIQAQSRSKDISVDNDNFGFARWVADQRWFHLSEPYVIFGEWVGPGVQSGVALTQIPSKTFAVFAVKQGEVLITEPDQIRFYVLPEIPVIPWHTDTRIQLWMGQENTAQVEWINTITEQADKICPWVKVNYNIEGPGEGFVFYPIDQPFEGYAFKSKGTTHRVTGPKAAQMKAPAPESVLAFAELVLTPARLEQMAGNVFTKENIGPFIGAVCRDVAKECVEELGDLDWKQVSNVLVRKAREWYIGRI